MTFDEYKEYWNIKQLHNADRKIVARLQDMKKRLLKIPCTEKEPLLNAQYMFWSITAAECLKAGDYEGADEAFFKTIFLFKECTLEAKAVIITMIDEMIDIAQKQCGN